MRRKGRIPSPQVLSINVCNDVLINEPFETLDLLGCFTVIRASEFPTTHPSIFVHLDFTGGRGAVPISLWLYPTDFEEMPVLKIDTMVDFINPCEIRRVCFDLGEVYFETAGEYTVTVFHDIHRIAERRVFLYLEE